MRLLVKIKSGIKTIISLDDSPEKIARGFALGSFIGMMPIPGFQVVVSLGIASILRWNRKAACIAVFNTNMATGLFVFTFNFWLGNQILGIQPEFTFPNTIGFAFVRTLFNAGKLVFLSLLMGGVLTGLFIAGLTYFLVKIGLGKRHTNKNISAIQQQNCKSTSKKYCVITGASSGLGKAMAVTCAKRRFHMILISLPNENLISFSKELSTVYDIDAIPFEVNLADKRALETLASTITSQYRVHILINNAGVGGSRPFDKVSENYLDTIVLLNIRSLVLLTHKLIDNLKQNSKAHILNIASMASFGPMPFKTIYPASKAFVYSFSRGLCAELHNSVITVSVAHPGGMATNPQIAHRISKHSKFVQLTILSPEKTADICIRRMLKNDTLIIPGFMNKISWLFLKICPVWLQLHIFSKSIQKEIKLENSVSYA